MQYIPEPNARANKGEKVARGEEALRESEERLSTTLRSIGDAVIATDQDGHVTLMNPVAQALTGWAEEEAIGRPLKDVFNIESEETGKPAEDPITKVIREGVVVGLANHTALIARDGTRRSIADSGAPIRDSQGNITGVVLVFRDVSERRRMEWQVQEARLYAESIVETVRHPLLVLDADLRVISANRSFYRTFQASAEETEGRLIYDLGNRQWDIPRLREFLEEILPKNISFRDFEVEYEFPIIGRKIMLLDARRIYRAGNRPQMILLTIEDITERRRAEEALRESEERFRFLSSATLEGVAIHDGGKILHVNEAYARMFGYEPSELIGAQVLDHVAAQSRELVRRNMLSGYEGLYEAVGLRKDGSTLMVEACGKAISYQGREVRAVAVRDITERKQVEEQLRRLTARLLEIHEEDRRQVAYDIHDGLGQLITAAAMHLEAFAGHRQLRQQAEAEAELEKGRHCLQDAVVEMRRMVSELGPLLVEDLGLVEACRRLLADVAGRENWETEFEGEVNGERLDRPVEVALFRIVQEALANARKHANTRKLRISFKREGSSLQLEVRDWGQGFDVDSMLHQAGQGRRVGLLSMRERTALIGGEFKIESAPDSGTKLTVTVPIAQAAQPAMGQKKAEVTNMVERLKGREPARQEITVLIVDDHPMVREGLRSMLQAEGIEVIGEASTGTEAIERVQQLNPDVVLMDVRMPDMDGLAATDVVKQNSPETSVIVITAYESKEYLRRSIEAGAAGYILKGMSRESLIEAIRLVRGGGSLVDARLLTEVLRELGIRGGRYEGATEGTLEILSPREREVLQLLVQGLTNKEIAQQMHYSVGTVKNVVQRVIEKLGVSDRTQAAVYAVRAGLNLE